MINDTYGQNPFNMRGTPVTKPGTFTDQQVKPLAYTPLYAGFNIGNKEMIRAQPSGKAFFHRQARTLISFMIVSGETVKLDDTNTKPLVPKALPPYAGSKKFFRLTAVLPPSPA